MTPRVREYAQEAARRHRVEVSAVLGASRLLRDCKARAEVMNRLRWQDGFSVSQIGNWLARDHSTVTYWTALYGKKRRRARRP